jgi:hypothetical protein
MIWIMHGRLKIAWSKLAESLEVSQGRATMTTWKEFAQQAVELAAFGESRF